MRAIAPKYTGRIWPNGKFGVSRVRETPFLPLVESQPETEETRWETAAIKVHGVEAVLKFQGKWKRVVHPDLSNDSKSPIAKKRGHGGITKHGRNLISSAAIVIEKKVSKRLLTFATVTLPAAPVEALLAVSQNWSAVVKQFVKNLRRGLTAAGLRSFVFGVTEIQEARLERTGIPALHLHLVFQGRNSERSSWAVDRKDVRRWWKQALSPYLPADTDYSSVENVQAIRKSAGSYLGKYMSKGAASIQKIIDAGLGEWLPSAWYTINHELRREVLSQVLRGENVGDFLNWLCHNPIAGWIRWLQPILVSRGDGSKYSVGFAGAFTAHGLDKIPPNVLRSRTTSV